MRALAQPSSLPSDAHHWGQRPTSRRQWHASVLPNSSSVLSSHRDLSLPAASLQSGRRAIVCCSSNGPGESPDIDALAKMLSQQAAQLRASLSEEDIAELTEAEAREQVVVQHQAITLGPELSAELEAKVMEEVGDGGFTSDDFEIVSRLGRISVQQANGPASTAQTAVIAYVARYIARIAYSLPVITLMKEYLPVAKAVACNELLLLQHLCGIPEDKYQASVSRPNVVGPPVVPLLGYFTSAPSEDAAEELAGSPQLDEDSLWLVYKWEGLRPVNLYMDVGPPEVQTSFFKKKEVAEKEAWARRAAMLRSLALKLLVAIDFIHSADVVHGSLSSGSVLMSSSTDLGDADDLVVKLDGFGFGKWYSAPGSLWKSGAMQAPLDPATASGEYGQVALDAALEQGKHADLQAAALLLAEVFAAGLAESATGRMPRPTLKRLLFDVFHEDVKAFKEYCLQDEAGSFQRFVEFMDEGQGAGWDFLSQLLEAKAGALQLSQHQFLALR